MLKLFIGLKNRLDIAQTSMEERFASKSESGFASAETIALAVAGVLIAGVAYAFFNDAIDGWLGKITGVFDKLNDTTT